MPQQTITSDNVEFGPCQVTFGGQDLGAFKGGVVFNYSYTLVTSKPDSLSTPNRAWMVSEDVRVRVPLLETKVDAMLRYIMPLGTYSTSSTKKKIEVGGDQIVSGDFQQLIITSITDGSATLSTDDNTDITIHKALCLGPVEKTFNMEGERVVNVEFQGFADTTQSATEQLFTFGDASF